MQEDFLDPYQGQHSTWMSFSPPRLVSGSGVIVYIKKKKNYVDDTIVTLATATPLVPSLSFEGRIAF